MGARRGQPAFLAAVAWLAAGAAAIAAAQAAAPAAAGAAPNTTATCGAAPDPPDSLFLGLTRLRPDDPTWTWNPWDTTPAVKDSAERFTCADFTFVHPGTIASPAQVAALPLVRSKGPAPARASLDALLAWATPDLKRPPVARPVVFVAYNPAPWDKKRMTPQILQEFDELTAQAKAKAAAGAAAHDFSDGDARRALNHTVAWLATGREAHADKATQILDAWATTTRAFGPRYANGPLEAAWGLALMARAAELLTSGGARAWTPAVHRRFLGFVDTLLTPNLRFYDTPNAYMAGNAVGTNWAGTILEARLQYAILREDLGELEFAARKAKGWLGSYVLPDGRTDETTNRDFMHAQFGIAGMVAVASLLYHQTGGQVDLFSYRSPLQAGMPLPPLAAAVELHAAALLGRATGALANATLRYIQSPPVRNDFKDANFEAALLHYSRAGVAMPNTEALLAKWRPEALVLNWGLGTLTVFGPECVIAAAAGPAALQASPALAACSAGGGA